MKMNLGRVFTTDEANAYFEVLLKKSGRFEELGEFKIFDANTNEYIGFGGVNPNKAATAAEIDYMLLPQYWNQGYGTKIVTELMDIAKKENTIKKLIAITDPNNVASQKVLTKNGFISSRVYEVEDGTIAEELILDM